MRRAVAILLAILLLLPTSAQAEWAMFGKDANHTGVAEVTDRTIQKRTPVVSWDRGSSSEEVYSWGTSIGNFAANIGGDPYDRDVLHIVYVTATEDDDSLVGKLIIRDGGSPGKVMWQRDLGTIRDQNNQSLQTDFENFEAAYGTPAIADFDGNGLMDIAVVTTNGVIHFFEPEIEYNSANEGYDAEDNGERWSHETDITVVRSNPAITSFDGGNDIVISGIDLENDEINIIAIDGSTGDRIWKFTAEGTEISSPAVLDDSSNRKVFVSVYNDGLEVYAIQGGSAISGWTPKTIGSIVDPDDPSQHPLLPSIVIADITDDSGKEILVPQPPATDDGDAQLWLFKPDGDYADGWNSAYELEGGGDIDATPAVGDIDDDGDLEIVAVTWEDPSATTNNELTHVWAIGNDATLEWETEYDTDSSGGWDDDEHAISSPILAVIYTEDGKNNLDVFTCTTPKCFALDGNDGLDGGGPKDQLWDITLEGRGGDNKIFTSPAASDVDGDGLIDFVIDGAVYSADLADLTLRSSDIVIADSDGNPVTEVEEGQEVTLYPITIRNDGNHDAQDVDIEVRLDTFDGNLLHEESIDIEANSIQNLANFTWVASGQGIHSIWVMCLIDADDNEEVRYDNNNASRSLLVRPQYGLELNITDSLEIVDVNQTATFDINITNMGLQTDNYTVSVTVMNPEWDISYPLQVTGVESNTTVQFSVSFVPGSNVTAAVHDFTITVASEGNSSRMDSVVVDISVNQYYGLNVEMPLTNQRVFPDTTLSYPVRITNQGNGADTFDLFTGNDWGAEIRIDNSPSGEVFLGAGRMVEAELRVTTPSDSLVGDYKELPFTVISQGDSNISESVLSNTSIGIMMAEEAIVGVLPGSKASFSLEFLNPTDQTDVFSVSITLGDPEWDTTISPTNISLDSGSKGNAWVNFTVPNTAEPETSYPMVFAFGNNQILDTINVILEIVPLSGPRLWSVDNSFSAYANPGETVYFDVRVVNYEDHDLDVELSYQEDLMEGWNVLFNNQSSWSKSIPAGGSTSVSVGATSPGDAEAIDTFWLRVIGTSSGFDPTYFDANITVNQEFGISISSKSTVTLLGNISELVKVAITNTGNGPDTFEVAYSGLWVQNEMDTFAFEGFETKEITILVNSGMVAPGSESTVLVQVNSTKSRIAGNEVSDTTTLSFIVTGMITYSEWGSGPVSLNQGETRSFDIAILSLFDSGVTSRVITEVGGSAESWVSFDNTEEYEGEDTLVVPVGEPDLFSVTVNVPEVTATGNYLFSLTVTDYNDNSHVSTLWFTVNVIQDFNITVEIISTPLAVNPGYSGEWLLDLTNNGNGIDSITMNSTDVPENWPSTFSDSVVELLSDRNKIIVFTLDIPEGTSSGEYFLSIDAQSLGTSVSVPLNITVNSVHRISASVTSEIELTGQPGETVYFQFDVTNIGNTNDTVSVTATGTMMSQATPTDFGWSTKSLSMSETESNYLKATVPVSNEGPWTAIVTVASEGDSSQISTFQFKLFGVILPDAGIRDLVLTPSDPKPGDNVMARFTITAVNAPIESIYYTIYLDGTIIGGDRAYSIEAGGSKLISYSFEATEGSHTFMVRLDVDGELEETDTTNNEIRQSIKVEKSGVSNLPIYLAVVAIVLVGGAVLYRYSTRDNRPSVETKMEPVVTESSVTFPLVLNCIQCGSRVRVARPGAFRCPSCKSVASVNSNGEIGSVKEKSDKSSEPPERPLSSTERRFRMEGFLSEEDVPEVSEEPEEDEESEASELSASEKLKLFRQEEAAQAPEIVKVEPESKPEPEPESPKKEKKTRKRRGPPKGGSFGPTIGGF